MTLSDGAKRLFRAIYQEQNTKEKDDEEIPKIKVSELISKFAFYYEKIRNVVEYKEEHLLRKNAIFRILKRQLVIEGGILANKVDSQSISKHLLTELIRAAYLPNNKVPEAKIEEVAGIIEKYIKLRKEGVGHKEEGDKKDLTGWIITMAACDIEERLGRKKVDQTIISNLYEILSKIIKLPEDSPFKHDREIQIYIAIHRALLKFDNDLTGFILFKYYNPNWREASESEIAKVGAHLGAMRRAVANELEHPLGKQMARLVKKYVGFSTILADVMERNPIEVYEDILKDPKSFPRDIKLIAEKRYKFAKNKLWRAALRSILYILITKSVLAVILEVPVIKLFGEEINYFTLLINVSLPAVLLFLAVAFTKLPVKSNTDKIIEGVSEITFIEHERQDPFVLRNPTKRSFWMNFFFGIIYMATFFISFGFVIWGLDKVGFNWVSIIIFLFFLTFASFFALRIRRGVRELMIIEPKETIFSLLLDFFYVPIVTAGKWLAEKFSRINIFVFILDFIIEAPFKIFVETADEWTKYVKERKEDMM